MNINEYQKLAARTINPNLTHEQLLHHALHGLASEVGQIHGLYQKVYQGHPIDRVHVIRQTGDLLWFIAELCTELGVDMSEVAQTNIDKLIARFPNGFEADRSLHRKEGDV